MRPNRSSGRYRHYVRVMARDSSQNKYGEPDNYVEILDARCNVQVKSGKELGGLGIPVTSELITVLMRYDRRIENDMFIEWTDSVYRIKHVRPDEHEFECVVTAEVKKDG